MPGGFVVGVHAEADPDIFGMGLGLFTGEAFRDADVAMGHEGVYLTRSEVLEGFVLEDGLHGGRCMVIRWWCLGQELYE